MAERRLVVNADDFGRSLGINRGIIEAHERGIVSRASLMVRLPPGVTELGCHPGYAADVDVAYREERAREVAALCDPAVRLALTRLGIELTTFARVSATLGSNGRQRIA